MNFAKFLRTRFSQNILLLLLKMKNLQKCFPRLYNKTANSCKARHAMRNAWAEVASNLKFMEDGKYIFQRSIKNIYDRSFLSHFVYFIKKCLLSVAFNHLLSPFIAFNRVLSPTGYQALTTL